MKPLSQTNCKGFVMKKLVILLNSKHVSKEEFGTLESLLALPDTFVMEHYNAALLQSLFAQGEVDGVVCIGGTGNYKDILLANKICPIYFLDHTGCDDFVTSLVDRDRLIFSTHHIREIVDIHQNFVRAGLLINSGCRYVEAGFVFSKDGKLCRAIEKNAPIPMQVVEEASNLGYVPKLNKFGESDRYVLYNIEEIPFVTRGTEWSVGQSVAILNSLLDFELYLLEHSCSLLDPHSNNFTFRNSKFIYFDYGSISNNIHKYGFLAHVMNLVIKPCFYGKPIVDIESLEREFEKWYTKHNTENHDVNELKMAIAELRLLVNSIVLNEPKCCWNTYCPEMCFTLEQFEANKFQRKNKYDYVLDKYKTYKPKRVVDLGGNIGYYSFMASTLGAQALVLENRHSVLDEGFSLAKKHNMNVDFALIDLFNVVESAVSEYVTSDSIYTRFQGDFCLASAITHHLSHGGEKSLSFERQVEMFNKLTTKYLLVEFIPSTDIHVKTWGMPESYTMDNYMKELNKYFSILEIADSEPLPRKWIFCEKKSK